MKTILANLTLMILFSGFASGQQELAKAREFVEYLKAESPKYHGISVNEYFMQDLDNDGTYEVIESTNKFNQEATGLLNLELAPAFDLHKIYKFENGSFTESHSDFRWYLTNRLEIYRFWKRMIKNPTNLSPDSIGLIKHNRELFIQEINRLIGLIEERIEVK